jgi:hypothetical protein
MSFGFGIGDFLTVFDKVEAIRKAFVAAPAEFKALSDEYVYIYKLHFTTGNRIFFD